MEARQGILEYHLEIENNNQYNKRIQVSTSVYTMNEMLCSLVETEEDIQVGQNEVVQVLEIQEPKLWYPEEPNLYKVVTKLILDTVEIDSYETVCGIRIMDFVPNKGFFLNDKHYNLKGVCLHHDGGVVGAAVPETIWRKRIRLLKEMGCNSIRTAHNPFAPEFYDLCDEMGMFVMDEIFDGWEKPKAPYDYGLYFKEWHEKDCIDFIKRDRNHASVFMWSIGNEVHGMEVATTQKLVDLFHQYDDTRKVTCGVQGVGENSDANRAVLDVAGYNDGGGACFAYERDHEKRPEQLIITTEAPHTLQTRGYYRTQTWWRDKNLPRIEIENLTQEELFEDGYIGYASSYDNHGVRVCARDSYAFVEKLPYLCGEFRWVGIDYIGESFGWPMTKGDMGVIDTANLKKDHYYLYQSMWCDPKIAPMVHILPHWTHSNLDIGTIIPVWIYTNCDQIELFLNKKSLGKREKGTHKNLQFDVPYEEGELRAVAYLEGQ